MEDLDSGLVSVDEEEPFDLFKSWTPEMLGLVMNPPISDETRQLMSEVHSARVRSPHSWEARCHMSEAQRQRFKDTPVTQESRENMSKAQIERFEKYPVSWATRKKQSEANFGRKHSEEVKKQISESKRVISEETRRKLSLAMLGKGHPQTQEARDAMSKGQTRRWADYSSSERDRIRSNMSKGRKAFLSNLSEEDYKEFFRKFRKAPNGPEELIREVLDESWPGDWEYTGGFLFKIGSKNPDFTNKTRRAVIEHFGSYYHNPWYFPKTMSEEELVVYYRGWGFDCVVLREEYLCTSYIVEKVGGLYSVDPSLRELSKPGKGIRRA